MNLRSAVSGFLASVSVILIALAVQQLEYIKTLVAQYPFYVMVFGLLVFIFRDKILDKLNIHNGG